MGRGISKQQKKILQLLKERAEDHSKFPWMSTRQIVMALHPEVQAYLDEEKRYRRIARANFFNPELHKMYEEHEKRLVALPNYHTVRTSVNRALRNLVKRGLVCRQEYWGMFQREGVSAGWLLPEMGDRFKENPKILELRSLIFTASKTSR